MDKLICNLCAGSPCFNYKNLYPIKLKTHTTYVDICIGKEIKYLRDNGINTTGCCCGHGSEPPHVLCRLWDYDKLVELGYNPERYKDNRLKCELKIDVQIELRKVLKMKTWRYLEED